MVSVVANARPPATRFLSNTEEPLAVPIGYDLKRGFHRLIAMLPQTGSRFLRGAFPIHRRPLFLRLLDASSMQRSVHP
jgi:hypothetical protein